MTHLLNHDNSDSTFMNDKSQVRFFFHYFTLNCTFSSVSTIFIILSIKINFLHYFQELCNSDVKLDLKQNFVENNIEQCVDLQNNESQIYMSQVSNSMFEVCIIFFLMMGGLRT